MYRLSLAFESPQVEKEERRKTIYMARQKILETSMFWEKGLINIMCSLYVHVLSDGWTVTSSTTCEGPPDQFLEANSQTIQTRFD